MAPRRSARLRSSQTPVTEDQFPAPPSTTPSNLEVVVENDESKPSPSPSRSKNNAITTTPQSQPHSKNLTPSSKMKSAMKTPSTASSMRPTLNEMHPSKAQQSTTKQPDSGLVLGFNPVKRDSNGKIIKETVVSNTPSKVKSSPPCKLTTPSKFDFRFSTDDSQLSDEARKLMESVREDVARIKAQMVLDHGEQNRKQQEADGIVNGRKIAQPKSKAGRFSDAHMAEFKKMDSIAGHASSFRTQHGRFTPVKSLKRKSSKACLDEPEQRPSPSKPPLEGTKRVKRAEGQDASTSRPHREVSTPKKTIFTQSSRPPIRSSSLMTPTKASASRFSSARASKTSMIPSLNRSPASRLAAPRTPKTDFNPRLKKSLPSLGNLKSILKRHQPLFSNDPTKVAAGTHLATPRFNPDINLTSLPTTSFGAGSQTPSPKKRVEFTSSTQSRYDIAQASPSPSKIPGPRDDPASSDIVYPTLPSLTPENAKVDTPTIRRVRDSISASQPATSLAKMPTISHGIPNKKRQHESEKVESKTSETAPSFAATLMDTPGPYPKLLAVPHGISNKKRQREDDGDLETNSKEVPKPSLSASNNSPSVPLLAVPHGINHKKRQRVDFGDDGDTENVPPAVTPTDEQRSAKRLKPSPVKMDPVSPSPLKSRGITPKRMTGSRTSTPGTASKKGILSLSRLNMLAKPKARS
ncbi:hypothetical protein BGW36DRAFT_436570 [Talaromyces proteolyticus]|uniref:Erythromycin esterase n=1 Tax=Talaromyces proteolyticus TaxID=1131652 RepID=A0AAD4KMV1_9EURO|nr:uncharacterized protein BGW36DRAFT_436570 [Talaromyces proteolyticus]KAH8692815.1 hypothetical protein BGW36DRAFT_436570 [Talaromyces proteolyticus]